MTRLRVLLHHKNGGRFVRAGLNRTLAHLIDQHWNYVGEPPERKPEQLKVEYLIQLHKPLADKYVLTIYKERRGLTPSKSGYVAALRSAGVARTNRKKRNVQVKAQRAGWQNIPTDIEAIERNVRNILLARPNNG